MCTVNSTHRQDQPQTVPFELDHGWPVAIAGLPVIACEAGISLGSVVLSERSWRTLHALRPVSVRIDDHTETEGWTTTHPDGEQEVTEFVVPTQPVEVPAQVDLDFDQWVKDTHGGLGRLMMWDSRLDWWLINDPDLELTLICADPNLFPDEFEAWRDRPFCWVNSAWWTDEGMKDVDSVVRMYGLTSSRHLDPMGET